MRLVIPGRPVPASRPRVTRGKMTAAGVWVKPHSYYPKAYSQWLADAAEFVRALGKPVSGAVAVTVIVNRDSIVVDVVSSKIGRPTSVKGDIDNLTKAVLDSLQRGGMLVNDSQVTELTVRFGEG